jgi:histidine decarboxylase
VPSRRSGTLRRIINAVERAVVPRLKGRVGIMPKCYFTLEAHYSIQILRDLLGMEAVLVNTLPDGGMDPGDLERQLAANRNHPALVVATVGTTFKGAIDDLDGIQRALQGHAAYLHLDAALFGGYLPHTPYFRAVLHQSEGGAGARRYDSIAVSCHKFFGFPAPAGLFIARKTDYDEFKGFYSRIHNPEYIGHVPGTITCSRDAVKPAEFYFFSTPEALAKQAEDAASVLRNTEFLLAQMQADFSHLLATRASPASNTVYFKRPGDGVVKKYSLATMQLRNGRNPQDYAHIVTMPHADQNILSEFLADLAKDSATRRRAKA